MIYNSAPGRCEQVLAILGHASISTTLDLYVHPGLADKKKAIEKDGQGVVKLS